MSVRERGDVRSSDGWHMRVLVVRPDGEPPAGGRPAVVVLYEIFGLQPDIVEVGERFAERGWVALIPDYLSGGPRIGCLVRTARELKSGRPGPVTERLAAATALLRQRPDVADGQIAVVGFCMGGGLALLLGTVDDLDVRAVAASYCDVPAEETLRRSPPVVASYGGRDLPFRANADVLQRRLDACGVANDVKLYPDAGHAFMTEGHHPVAAFVMRPLRAGHVPDAADDAWARIFAWLDAHVLKIGSNPEQPVE